MKKELIYVLGLGIIIIIEIITFLYLDKVNYLHKGISVRKYEFLPFYTKIQGDHDVSGFYYFLPTYRNGLNLEASLIFNNEIHERPTLIYSQTDFSSDTVCLSRIIRYGYNEKDLVIETLTTEDIICWLQPVWHNKKILVTHVKENEINKDNYQWVTPMSSRARQIMVAWLIFIAIIPTSILYELYLVAKLINYFTEE